MRLYFLRHGQADWPNWNRPDDERPLTERGKKEMRKVAKFLKALDVSLDHILSSPLPRARQTADIVAERFKLHVHEDEMLANGFNAQSLKQLLHEYSVDNIMIVGHEPSFGHVIAEITGGDCKLSKGGVALVDLDEKKMKGQLFWLFPPKFAKVL
jgi:phosphohistidine phosphatase